MFPKKGNNIPGGPDGGGSKLDYAASIAAALRQELGDTHRAIKTVMRWTGANERTVKNWFAGKSGPNGAHLIGLIRHSDDLLEAVLLLADRNKSIAAERLIGARNVLAQTLERIDQLVGDLTRTL